MTAFGRFQPIATGRKPPEADGNAALSRVHLKLKVATGLEAIHVGVSKCHGCNSESKKFLVDHPQ